MQELRKPSPIRSDSAPHSLPRIRDRLAGKSILVTGTTGFLAKALLEKLLRSVATLDSIYLLVRPGADGLPPQDRVQRDILNNRAFDRLRALLGPGFQRLCDEKIRVVGGDLTRDRLGLAAEEYAELTSRITLVVNSAATVTFDERLDWAVELNARGPHRVLQLAKDCGNAPMLHVSTCYVSGSREGEILEDFSAPECARETLRRNQVDGSFDLDAILEELATEAGSVIARIGSDRERCRMELIDAGMCAARRHGWNDTYTFTKWIGEQLLVRDRAGVPLVIFRPAIIEGSWEEPLPGWIDGLRMADPVVVAYGRGKLREFPGRPGTLMDLIPVDFVVNGLCAALPVGVPEGVLPAVIHCATSDRNPLTLEELTIALHRAFLKRPMTDEHGRRVTPRRLRLVETEAFMQSWRKQQRRLERSGRLLTSIGGDDRRARRAQALSRQIDQILYFAKIYAPYTHQNRRFADDNLRRVSDLLHPDDRSEFPFLAERIDWNEYVVDRHVPGVRSFVLGAGPEPTPVLKGLGSVSPKAENRSGDQEPAHTIFEVFLRTSSRYPEKPALRIQREGRWTTYRYGEALEATGSIMHRFLELGLAPGDRIVLSSENGPEWGLTYLAAMRAGLVVVPLDPQLPSREAWQAARFTKAKLICAGLSTKAGFSALRRRGDAEVIALRAPFVPPPGASRDRSPEPVAGRASATASILFTSGTTVMPRAVPLTHRNLVANAEGILAVHPIHATDEFLSVLPLYHVFEFMAGLVVPMTVGATVTYVDQLKGPEILAAMQATGTTVMLVVPRLLQMFHDSLERQIASASGLRRNVFSMLGLVSGLTRHRFARRFFKPIHKKFGGRLRMFVSGGSRLDPHLLLAFQRLGFPIYEGYGMTETSPVLTVSPPGSAKPGGVGPPLPNVELQIRDRNADGIGEVWVRGPSVMSGYLDNDTATREVLIEGWLRTGDLGRQDQDGCVFLTGRSKDLIVTGAGKNIYPDELEVHYRDLPYVKELCVFGMPAAKGQGDEVHAVVAIDADATRDIDRSSVEREIHAAAAAIGDALPSHQRIGTLHFWERELPKTSTLKAKRGLIREIIRGTAPVSSLAEAGDDHAGRVTESGISTVSQGDGTSWPALQRTLSVISRRPPHSIRKDMHLLLDLGVDSIGKVDVISAVEAQFGIRIDDETGSRVTRVGELLELIGDRSPVSDGTNGGGGWRRWLSRSGSAARPNEPGE